MLYIYKYTITTTGCPDPPYMVLDSTTTHTHTHTPALVCVLCCEQTDVGSPATDSDRSALWCGAASLNQSRPALLASEIIWCSVNGISSFYSSHWFAEKSEQEVVRAQELRCCHALLRQANHLIEDVGNRVDCVEPCSLAVTITAFSEDSAGR